MNNPLRKPAAWAARKGLLGMALLVQMFDLRDVFWICGLSAVGYGVWQVNPPLAWCVCGGALFWLGVRR